MICQISAQHVKHVNVELTPDAIDKLEKGEVVIINRHTIDSEDPDVLVTIYSASPRNLPADK